MNMNSYRGQDLSVSFIRVLLHAVWMTVLFFTIPLIPFNLIWGGDALWTEFLNPNIILPALLLVVAHEFIHAIGWKYAGGLTFRDFKIGLMWKTLSPYCHATKPMSIRAYRFGAILPCITLGIIPVATATLIGNGYIAILGGILTAGAVGDIYVLWLLRHIPATKYVIDHPTRVGCIVLDTKNEDIRI